MSSSVDQVPVFGQRDPGRDYVRRPSVYTLLYDAAGNVAVVRTPRGCYLPGGGAEKSETPQQTVEREAREECGFILRVHSRLGSAIQFCYSEGERAYFEKICDFLGADLVGVTTQTEPDHQVLWVSPEQACSMLLHESHRWAVQRFCSGGKIRNSSA
ncbi:MAG TPA: NUDIX domain-containing protein [Candidatus Angelobacter sp.]|nr:NUDIX domain-containing protein [Candidatus Angelobacter sp.]